MNLSKWACSALLVALLAIGSAPASAANPAFAQFESHGSLLEGETSVEEIGGVDVSTGHIEVFEFRQRVSFDERRPGQHRPSRSPQGIFEFKTRIGAESVGLIQAWRQRGEVSGTIKFFKTDPGNGSTYLATTIEIEQGFVATVEIEHPDTLDSTNATIPPTTTVKIVPHVVTTTDVVSGTSFSFTNN